MKRRSSTEYVSKIRKLTIGSVSHLNQALSLLKPALDGGLITQVEYQDLGVILVAEFHYLCKNAEKMRNWEDYQKALEFGEELAKQKFLGKTRLRKEKEFFIEQYSESLQYKYGLYGMKQSGINSHKKLRETTVDGKYTVETYRTLGAYNNQILANFVNLTVYDEDGLIHPDIRVSDFIEVEMPPVESVYQTEEEYFDLITKEVRRLDKEIEEKFEDLVTNKKEFNKVLRKNMIIASSKSVVAKYMKSAKDPVEKILFLIEKGDHVQGELLGETLYESGQLSKKDWLQIQLALLRLRITEAKLDYDDLHGGTAISIKDPSIGKVDFYVPLQMRYGLDQDTDDTAIVVLVIDFDRALEVIPHDFYDPFVVGDYMWLDRAGVESNLTFDVSDSVKDIEAKLYKEKLRLEKVFQKNASKILERKLNYMIRVWAY